MYPLVDTNATLDDTEHVDGEHNDMSRLTEELAAAQQQLQDMASDNEAFIASFAHDIKNPLTTIMGRIELLKRLSTRPTVTPADIARHIEPLDTAVNRLSQLIQNFSTGTQGAVKDET